MEFVDEKKDRSKNVTRSFFFKVKFRAPFLGHRSLVKCMPMLHNGLHANLSVQK